MPCHRIRIPPCLKPTDEFDLMMLDAGIVPRSMQFLKDANGCLRDEFACKKCDDGCKFDSTTPRCPEDKYSKLARDLKVWGKKKYDEQENTDAGGPASTVEKPRARKRGRHKKSRRRHSAPISRRPRRGPRGYGWTAADCDTDCSCSDSDDLGERGEHPRVSLERARRNRERRRLRDQGVGAGAGAGRGGFGVYGGGGYWGRGGYGGGGYDDDPYWDSAYSDEEEYRRGRGGRGNPYCGGDIFDIFSRLPFGFGFGSRY